MTKTEAEEIVIREVDFELINMFSETLKYIAPLFRKGDRAYQIHVSDNRFTATDNFPLEVIYNLDEDIYVSYTLSLRPVRNEEGESSIAPFVPVPAYVTIMHPELLKDGGPIVINWACPIASLPKNNPMLEVMCTFVRQLWYMAVKDVAETVLRETASPY